MEGTIREPLMEGWSRELKNWYSYGAFAHHLIVFSSSGAIWFVVRQYLPYPIVLLAICFIVSLVWAMWGASEPPGSPGAGKFELTRREILYSFTNSFFLWIELRGVEALTLGCLLIT
jgi:hypothetical protein